MSKRRPAPTARPADFAPHANPPCRAGVGVCLGLAILLLLRRVLPRLEAAPLDAWHAKALKQQ